MHTIKAVNKMGAAEIKHGLVKSGIQINMIACSSPEMTCRSIQRIMETIEAGSASIAVLNNGGGTTMHSALASFNGYIDVFETSENIGVARGRNVLMQHFFEKTNHKYVVNIDNDVYPGYRWLHNLIHPFGEINSVGITAPMTNYTCNDQQRISMPNPDEDQGAFLAFCMETKRENVIYTNGYPIGFCTCVSRHAAEAIGYYDENYRFYGNEDADYYFTARKLGVEAMLVGDSFVYHYGSIGLNSLSPDQASQWNASRRYFMRKWGFTT